MSVLLAVGVVLFDAESQGASAGQTLAIERPDQPPKTAAPVERRVAGWNSKLGPRVVVGQGASSARAAKKSEEARSPRTAPPRRQRPAQASTGKFSLNR